MTFWAIFCPFSPLKTWKIKILKWKKHLEILLFYTFAQQMTIIWCMVPEIWSVTDSIFCHSGTSFALLPPMDPQNQNLKKWRKTTTTEDIIILQMCTINESHMMYGFWDMECNRQNFLSFWTVSCPFTLLTTQKIKILKKWKKHLEILSFYTSIPKMTIIWCMVPEILSTTDWTFCHFGPFFTLLLPLTTRKIKILKNWKKHLEILSFSTSVP